MNRPGPGQIRARKRPGVVLAVAFSRLLLGLCLALPLSSLAVSDMGLGIDGDRALFEAGGYLLLEAVRVKGPDFAALLRGLLPLVLLGIALTMAGNAALLAALNVEGKLSPRRLLATALRHVPAFLVIGVGTTVAQGLLLGIGVIAAGALPESMSSPRGHDAQVAAAVLGGALMAGAASGFSDVLKATLVRYEGGLQAALSGALTCLKRRPFATCFGWLPFALVWMLAVGTAAFTTSALDVGKPGGQRVLAVFLLHQAVVLASVALRAGWFARALCLTAVWAGAPSRALFDTAVHSGAPLGPTTHRPASPDA